MNLSALYRRDLLKLLREIQAYPDDGALWRVVPGVINSAGTLVLHLEGNLRDFIGRQLGGVAYTRQRALEFTLTGLRKGELEARVEELGRVIPATIESLTPEGMKALYPMDVLGVPLATEVFLIHLYGHLNWHLGQMDVLRRALTGDGAIAGVGLEPGR